MTHAKNKILIDLPMPIETDRLIIREPRFGDGASLNEAKLETWDLLNQWMPWAREKTSVEEDEVTCREAHVNFLKKEDLMMFAFEKDTGRFVGGTGLHRFDWDKRHVEIGYWYRKSVHGKGYATEATKALIKFAFEVIDAPKVIIAHGDGNEASKRVIEKCGFQHEYTSLQDYHTQRGEVLDHLYYSLFDADHLSDFNVKW